MLKKEMCKLRTLNATKCIIRAMGQQGQEKRWDGKTRKYRYHMAGRCQQLGGILKVSVFTREDIEKGVYAPKWDVFLNYEGDEYITRERQEDGTYKWREAMIGNLEDYWYRSDYDKYMYINPEGESNIKQILGTKNKGCAGIAEWQKGCKKRREDRKIKELTEQWDREMKPVKDPPGGFSDWWKHNGFDGENYIYYSGAGASEGYCTSCLEIVSLKKDQKHNEEGYCQKCGKRVTYISRAKKHNAIWTSTRTVSCIQRYKEGLVQRDFNIRRIDSRGKDQVNRVEFTATECRRILVLEKKYRVYVYEDYKRRGMRWRLREDQSVCRNMEKMYPKNISQLLKEFHTSYPIAVKHGYKAGGVAFFLTRERQYPVIEMAYKAGLYTLGEELLNGYWRMDRFNLDMNQHELGKMLGIDKARMQRLKQMDGGIDVLLWLQEEKKKDTIYRDEDISTMAAAGIEPELQQSYKAFKYLTIEKICNYLNRQAKLRGDSGNRKHLETVWNDWNDYISMMERMKMDCTMELLLKPKDLLIAHNELVVEISMKNSDKEIKATEKKYPEARKLLQSGELKKYEYRDDKFCIIAPTGIDDIYREGMTLKHCIHTCDIYFQRMDIKETYLLFLRRTADPERPWYTLEMEPGGNIRQKKSILNEAYKDLDEAMPFLKKWQRWVKTNLSKEDKELAEKSDMARREGYKKLREEKKLIWHGRLQGTLLADALEDDFMEAI